MKCRPTGFMALGLLLALAACSSSPPPPPPGQVADRAAGRPAGAYKIGKPYQIAGRWYHPAYDPDYDKVGTGSWYGEQFQGRLTANGEIFDKELISAAHPTLPLPSIVRVTNLENGRTVDLRVNDRGPFVDDREIDLSEAAARKLGYQGKGLAEVRVQFLGIAPDALDVPQELKEPEVQVASAELAAGELYEEAGSKAVAEERREEAAPFRASTVEVRQAVEAASVPADCASRGDPLFVQVGAFSDPARAERSRLQVAPFGQARLEPVFVRGEALLRLRVGPETDPGHARALLAKVQAAGHPQAFLTENTGPSKPAIICGT
ncbi:septal ring lytic transglycosylase RlpA family protein [Geminicoccus roseus]|uniref:septal ring lytic transglycosylase RlpA family protein n=1 Tax=Geminicoccus roseus TaxID=404900 RepID=UPI0006864BCB|nr:septal ring lytic transglycosylase RlpA family protein [Geminicoccus roseus]